MIPEPMERAFATYHAQTLAEIEQSGNFPLTNLYSFMRPWLRLAWLDSRVDSGIDLEEEIAAYLKELFDHPTPTSPSIRVADGERRVDL